MQVESNNQTPVHADLEKSTFQVKSFQSTEEAQWSFPTMESIFVRCTKYERTIYTQSPDGLTAQDQQKYTSLSIEE